MSKNMFAVGITVAGVVVGYGVYSYVQKSKEHQIKSKIDKMMSDLSNAPVYIRDPVGLRQKLRTLLEEGADNIQCITDFDGTLTKATFGGKKAQTTFAVLAQSSLLPEHVKTRELEMRAEYLPIERASDKTKLEKSPHMEKWWREIFINLQQGGLQRQMVRKMVKDGTSILREGCAFILKMFHDQQIPVLIFSAGVGDVVKEVVDQQAEKYENISYISNFIDWDTEGNMKGVIAPIDDKIMHSFNKGEVADAIDCEGAKDRSNIILLGDNEGDACMIKTFENVKTSLQIGFLNDNVNELRKSFEQIYDIVIVDSESMVVVSILLKQLLGDDEE